jgi:hypothetical protein
MAKMRNAKWLPNTSGNTTTKAAPSRQPALDFLPPNRAAIRNIRLVSKPKVSGNSTPWLYTYSRPASPPKAPDSTKASCLWPAVPMPMQSVAIGESRSASKARPVRDCTMRCAVHNASARQARIR